MEKPEAPAGMSNVDHMSARQFVDVLLRGMSATAPARFAISHPVMGVVVFHVFIASVEKIPAPTSQETH